MAFRTAVAYLIASIKLQYIHSQFGDSITKLKVKLELANPGGGLQLSTVPLELVGCDVSRMGTLAPDHKAWVGELEGRNSTKSKCHSTRRGTQASTVSLNGTGSVEHSLTGGKRSRMLAQGHVQPF